MLQSIKASDLTVSHLHMLRKEYLLESVSTRVAYWPRPCGRPENCCGMHETEKHSGIVQMEPHMNTKPFSSTGAVPRNSLLREW